MIHLKNKLYVLTFFVLFTTYLSALKRGTRRKRLLHFPEKTNVVLTMSLLKLFPSETVLNTLTEYDVSFPVPLHPYKLPNKRVRRQVERSIILEKFETICNLIGCQTNLICAMKNFFQHSNNLEDDNLMKDILTILFNLKNHREHCKL